MAIAAKIAVTFLLASFLGWCWGKVGGSQLERVVDAELERRSK